MPDQLRAEWAEYQLIFSDLLNRQSAMLARHAKAEKERLSRSLSEAPRPESSQPPRSLSRKAQLRSRAASALGLSPLRERLHKSAADPQSLQLEIPEEVN